LVGCGKRYKSSNATAKPFSDVSPWIQAQDGQQAREGVPHDAILLLPVANRVYLGD